MRVLLVSTTCSRARYEKLYTQRKRPVLNTSQKFFNSLLTGLEQVPDVHVDCLSVLPVSRNCYNKMVIHSETEIAGKITYHYVGFLNFPVLKSITSGWAMSSFLYHYLRMYKNERMYVVCDPLLMEATAACIYQCRSHHASVVGFLTDIPFLADGFDSHEGVKGWLYRLYNKCCFSMLKRFDSYVFLAEAMNDMVNVYSKPYLILECLVNSSNRVNTNPEPNARPIVLYAGKYHKEFGLDILADSLDYVQTDCELHLYGGQGNYTEDLIKKSKKDDRFKVMGILPEDEVIKMESKSTLLVNPRPSSGEFTRFSFPSKTAEYMMTGVPVLMYKLPCIPDAYDDYLYYAGEETAQGFAKAIDAVLSLPIADRLNKGKSAQQFILNEKNSVRQATCFVDFLKGIDNPETMEESCNNHCCEKTNSVQ